MQEIYELILVESDSDHKLSKYVEDDEELFVVNQSGEFWLANEFFYQVDLKKFTITEM